MRRAAVPVPRAPPADHPRAHAQDRPRAEGNRADERAVRHQRRHCIRARSKPSRVAHRSICRQGHRRAAAEDRGRVDDRQEDARVHVPHRRTLFRLPAGAAELCEVARVPV